MMSSSESGNAEDGEVKLWFNAIQGTNARNISVAPWASS